MPHELLTSETIAAYIAADSALSALIDTEAITDASEIGDGNLNLVFIVRDRAGRSLVLKQAMPYVRMVGPEWPLSPDRARHEAEAMATHGRIAPTLVPRIFAFDADRCIIAMEDLSDHLVWRHALIAGLRHDGAARSMGEYIAAVAFGTSVLSSDPENHKLLAAASANPQMCAISEDLVFTEPYFDIGRNNVLPANAADAADLAADDRMVRDMGRAKWMFMTQCEALIHGDLHTGSVMVRAADVDHGTVESAKAFDSEFSFYGPVAFDLGCLWANYSLAAARATALGDDGRARWCLDLCDQTWRGFDQSFRALWPSRRDPRVFTDDFGDELLARWRAETWLFTGAEMARRVVGLAKTADIETLPEELREGAARGALQLARTAVRDRTINETASGFIELASSVLRSTTTR